MSRIGRGFALLGVMAVTAAPVAAEPITYSFSMPVTQAFGPIQDVFGRSFVRGDVVTGRAILDVATLGPDTDPRPTGARYAVGTGRVVFDVPSGFTMEAAAIQTFDALTENNAPGTTVDFIRLDLWDQISVTPWIFNALLITWVDPTGVALSSTAWPTSTAGFRVSELRFNGYRGNTGSITLYGDDPAPVPEPGTLGLLAAGLAAVYRRARQRASGNAFSGLGA